MRLEGKVAIISGGARGQGAAEAKMFAREGAKVVFGDILDNDGKQVEAEINETGGDATYINLDVTDEGLVEERGRYGGRAFTARWTSSLTTRVSPSGHSATTPVSRTGTP